MWFLSPVLGLLLRLVLPYDWGNNMMNLLLYLQMLVFICLYARTMDAYRRNIYSYYVDLQFTDFGPVRRAGVFMLAMLGMIYLRLTIPRPVFSTYAWVSVVYLVISVALLLALGYSFLQMRGDTVVLSLRETIVHRQPIPTFQTEEAPAPAVPVHSRHIEDCIEAWTASPRKSYLREGITLGQVADEMRVPAQELSGHLNAVLQKNFNVWINDLRIEEAKRLFAANPKLSATEAALLCGFADVAMLSKNFRRATNLTITEFKRRNSHD